MLFCLFFFNDTATTEIYTLSLHDALPISHEASAEPTAAALTRRGEGPAAAPAGRPRSGGRLPRVHVARGPRSEEHTSELQSRQYLVCRLLLEKKKKK